MPMLTIVPLKTMDTSSGSRPSPHQSLGGAPRGFACAVRRRRSVLRARCRRWIRTARLEANCVRKLTAPSGFLDRLAPAPAKSVRLAFQSKLEIANESDDRSTPYSIFVDRSARSALPALKPSRRAPITAAVFSYWLLRVAAARLRLTLARRALRAWRCK
jgi:hypothetical protein